VPPYRKLWTQSVVGYTFAGLVSATVVGATLGLLGRWLGQLLPREEPFLVVGVLSLVLVVRELGWISFPLPSRRRQTERTWANQFGFRAAAIMWGFDIGLGFSTWVQYGGFWMVVAVILAAGDSGYGAVLLGSYWLGRALPVWFSPWLLREDWIFSTLFEDRSAQDLMYRRMNLLGLAWTGGIVFLMVGTEGARIVTWIIGCLNDLGWFYVSYILVWGLTLVPALLLHQILREIMWLSQQRDDLRSHPHLHVPGLIPQFSASMLGTKKTVTPSDLIGQDTMLLFVRPEDAAHGLDKQLRTSTHGLWHKTSGKLYIVCSGNTDECRELLPELQFSERVNIPVLLDQDGAMARAFQVKSTPIAFRLDAETRIVGFGRQLSSIPPI